MGEILSAIKSPAAKAILAARPELRPMVEINRPRRPAEYRFRQKGGGYDRNVTTPKAVWSMIHYIHQNPVRRGLCASPFDWPWSSALAYEGKEAPIPVDLCTWYDDV